MKKSLALILILCMALASVPALGETDFTGSWYLTLSGMICGVFELKDDGTCTGSTAASDTEAKASLKITLHALRPYLIIIIPYLM